MSSADKKKRRVALVGNPNVGKTSLFNELCGLNQKTGNYPGVTVDKKRGYFRTDAIEVEVIDLPGINSLFPNSKDEELVLNYLLNPAKDEFPDVVVLVVSALNFKRNMYVADQLMDLKIPVVLAVNMIDLADKRGIKIDVAELKSELGIEVIPVSAKSSAGIAELKSAVLEHPKTVSRPIHFLESENQSLLSVFAEQVHTKPDYRLFLNLVQDRPADQESINLAKKKFVEEKQVSIRKWKVNESILRYKYLASLVQKVVHVSIDQANERSTKADKILLHPVWGYVIFLLIMFGIFQSVFWLAAYPMDWIDSGFLALSGYLSEVMPAGYLSQLLTEGLIPGIGGVVIFVPQIAILFLLFSVLEESGYMARIVFLMDRLMQKFGMSGKSIVPLISGFACAVPAIMSARTIENKKERLITILVTPLLTCSARIPVYTVVIALIIPDETVGIFNYRGIALMALYLLAAFTALIAAWVFHKLLKNDFQSYLILEMPEYLFPRMRNVLITVWNNVKAFLWNAGKIIVATSVILFVLATNGLDDFKNAEVYVDSNYSLLTKEERQQLVASRQLESSFLGMIGQGIEPAIRPLGYDWKIGIAIVSSLAAREVFVGTISIIYSIGSDEEMKVADRLRSEKYPHSDKLVFDLATCVSLLLFYAFSLQCLSTIAITYKETQSLQWTTLQFVYMTALAYFTALIAYQVLK